MSSTEHVHVAVPSVDSQSPKNEKVTAEEARDQVECTQFDINEAAQSLGRAENELLSLRKALQQQGANVAELDEVIDYLADAQSSIDDALGVDVDFDEADFDDE